MNKVSARQHQAALGPRVPLLDPAAGQMLAPLEGVVQSIYPLDDPLNKSKTWFCDVQLYDGYGILTRVWIARPAFHQETKRAAKGNPVRRYRNAYDPWTENGTGGWHQSVLPGAHVVVQFINGQRHRPFISHFWPASGQGSTNDQPHGGGYPFNSQSRFRMRDGAVAEEVVKRLDAQVEQVPQWTWLYNGAFIEILNDGTLLVQSSVNKTPFIPVDVADQGLKKSPTPEGNMVFSTRGAQRGDFAITTGKSEKLGVTNARGNVLILTVEAKQGSVVVNAQSDAGHIIGQASKTNSGSQIFLRAKDADDYLHIQSGLNEVSGSGRAVLRSRAVRLGSRDAPYKIALHPQLYDLLDRCFTIYDSHTHPDVQSGDSDTGPPNEPIESTWMQGKEDWDSDVVQAEKSHSDDEAKKPAITVGGL